ncbi:MAG: hypothetical protein AAB074_04580 [Planctomycetota bacterium]
MSAPRPFQEARLIETFTSFAAVPPARLFRSHRRSSPAELAILGAIVLVVWIIRAVRSPSGNIPSRSPFRRFRR